MEVQLSNGGDLSVLKFPGDGCHFEKCDTILKSGYNFSSPNQFYNNSKIIFKGVSISRQTNPLGSVQLLLKELKEG